MKLPTPNQKVELEVLQGPHAGSYPTQVLTVDKRVLVLVHPMVSGNLVVLSPGDEVRLSFAVPGTARIALVTRVTGVDERGLPVVMVSVPDDRRVERYQQRDFFRLEVRVPLTYSVLYAPDDVARPASPYESYTRDLSGNGAQIMVAEAYPGGTQLDLHLQVDDHVIHTVGEVVRLVERVGPRQCWVGVRFLRLVESDRELIIRFVFRKQREQRKKGLL